MPLIVAVEPDHDEVVGVGHRWRAEVLPAALLQQDGEQERPGNVEPDQGLQRREGVAIGAGRIVGARQRRQAMVGQHVVDARDQPLVRSSGHAHDPPAVVRLERDRRVTVAAVRTGVEQIVLQRPDGALAPLPELAVDAGAQIAEPTQIELQRLHERIGGARASLQHEAWAAIHEGHRVSSDLRGPAYGPHTWGPGHGPANPQRSSRPGEPGALLDPACSAGDRSTAPPRGTKCVVISVHTPSVRSAPAKPGRSSGMCSVQGRDETVAPDRRS